jgi:hypothetical protein
MNFHSIFLIIIVMVVLTTPMIQTADADPVTFTPVSFHHNLGVGHDFWTIYHPSFYEGAYLSPLGEPTYWSVNGTSVTVSFPDTPDPSVIGLGNWLAAGMYVMGFDSSHTGEDATDWGYYTVLVLEENGDLYLDVGIYAMREWDPQGLVTNICSKTWLIGGLDHSTPVTLTTMWTGARYVDWSLTISGTLYDPIDSVFDMSGEDDPTPTFQVGLYNLESWKTPTWNPYDKCYYFQFGFASPYPAQQTGWSIKLKDPQYNVNSVWFYALKAKSIGGYNAFVDYVWKWGGKDHPGIAAEPEQKGVTFHWTGYDSPDNTVLWDFLPGGGYCPFVSVWNSTNFALTNNVLPRSELSNGADVEDYYRLEQAPVPKSGKYSLLLSEFESEHSYFDQAQLFAVDHSSDLKIAFTPTGELLTYKNPVPPISAIDDDGASRLNEISLMDGNVSDPVTYFQGYPGDYLILNFGQVNSENAKLIVRDDMKKQIECILVQVKDGNGAWQTVETLVPRAYWSVEAVNLSPYVVQGQNLWVRLYWKYPHRLDFVGLDTTPQDNYEIRYGNLVSATHSTQGDVKPLLLYSDNLHTELVPGQQIQLEFTLPNNSRPAGTYVFYTKGHYYTIP